jgi:hypothetical protein
VFMFLARQHGEIGREQYANFYGDKTAHLTAMS